MNKLTLWLSDLKGKRFFIHGTISPAPTFIFNIYICSYMQAKKCIFQLYYQKMFKFHCKKKCCFLRFTVMCRKQCKSQTQWHVTVIPGRDKGIRHSRTALCYILTLRPPELHDIVSQRKSIHKQIKTVNDFCIQNSVVV